MSEFETRDGRPGRALDRSLARTFHPPQVPRDFRRRLEAALARVGEADLSELRLRLDSERRADLARLEDRYVRLRRRTLGAMVGAAFAAGASVPVILPWLQRHLGAPSPLILSWGGAAAGLAIALLSWRAHARGGTW